MDKKRNKRRQQSGSETDTPTNEDASVDVPPVAATAAADSYTAGPGSDQKAYFLRLVDESSEAVKLGDYQRAVRLYSDALSVDPANATLFSNRSAALVKLGQHKRALHDARQARDLNPQWPKGHYREAVALQCLGQEAEALAAYASALAHDHKSEQLLTTFIEASLQSPLKDRLNPVLEQLEKINLSSSPFVVTAVVGQELLSSANYSASVTVLESALRIGTCSQKLRGSVFSALSSAHWGMGSIDKAIACMQQDLAVAKSLGDQQGECRAHGNLGAAYFSKGAYREALGHHRSQLAIAMRLKDRVTAAGALDNLGHVYTALGDYNNALFSHKQCVLLVKQAKDKLHEAKEIGNVGAVYLAMGQIESALECHMEHLKLAKSLGNRVEEARAYSNMGSTYHYQRDFEKAITFHNQVLNIALDISDRTLEARAYAGLGHAARCTQDYTKAKYYHEKQLDNALQTKDKVAEGRACSNLGIIYHHFGAYEPALKLHKAHLKIAKDVSDRASQGRAYGNIGNAHSALGQYKLAISFHKQELAISREVNDKNSECSTHGNLAVAYQALNMLDKAIQHYNNHLNMARELKDIPSEARALSNIGNFYSSRKQHSQALPYYEQYLVLSQEIQDTEGEGKACHKLGYVHYCLGNFPEAIRYYEQDLALAKDVQDKVSMCRAYCNLGLAHQALGDFEQALECQKYFLATSHMVNNALSKFTALGNIGDVLLKLEQQEEAVNMYSQQLQLARTLNNKKFEATANCNLGRAHKLLSQFDKALACHTQELTLYQELSDLKGECQAHSSLGGVHLALNNYTNAYRCYEEQLDRSRDLKDSVLEAQAYGNLAITKMNTGQLEDAIGLLEQQLAMLAHLPGHQALLDTGRAHGSLGDCYEALGDCEEAVKNYEQYLAVAQNTSCLKDQDKAYRGLGNAHRAMGNLQQALVCFEKRLVVAHELDKTDSKSSAYGELGCLHSLLGNFEQAVSCLHKQLELARETGDTVGEGEAACGLGGVYQQMGEYERALEYQQLDLQLAKQAGNAACQGRAYGNLGLAHESLGNFDQAVKCQEQNLNIATQMNDVIAKTLAYSSLGRIHHAMGEYAKAVSYLRDGLHNVSITHPSPVAEDEAKIRHRLGLALWAHGQLEEAQAELFTAVELFENIRREAQFNNDYKLSLFDLQTASYQALQRVLVSLERHQEALVVAERGRTRAFVDLLVERQTVSGAGDTWYTAVDSTPPSNLQNIMDIVNKQKAAVLYYSMAAGYLYSWLILPEKGVVKFHESSVVEGETGSEPEDAQSLRSIRSISNSAASVLDNYVGQARESLGIESHLSSSRLSLSKSSFVMSETESEADDLWQQHLEEIGDRLNAENDRTGFLRMVNRNHLWNSSSYSLGSMVSYSGSASGLFGGGRAPSIRSNRSSASSAISIPGKPPLSALYDLLIAPFEDVLPKKTADSCQQELILVLQGDLYLVPFSLLKNKQAAPFLYEHYDLLVVPSIRAVQASQAISKHNRYSPDCTGAVVIGNPKIPQAVTSMWQWAAIPGTEEECRLVAEMMGCRSLTGASATKDNVMRQIQRAELLHFATHVSWKLSAIVVTPGEYSSSTSVHGNLERMELNDSHSDLNNSFDGPPLSDFLLTAADVLNTRISAKLVVLSSGHTDDRAGRINADGVVGLTRAFLAAGAQCVLFSLWPVPEMAARILLKSFYTCLLQGAKTSHALTEAIRTVQNTRQFAHPSNWGSWLLVGSDIKLSSKVALMGHALSELLKTPARSREAMRVVLHLVEKSLQRINKGQRSAMYTTQHSIQNKVGEVAGWRDLLTSMGFRFEAAVDNLPASVFFPTTDPGDRLSQCSASLQALLGLAVPTLTALSKMIEHQEVGEALSQLLKEVSVRFAQENNMQMQVGVRLWRAPGCHEFLASLGFDLVEVGKDEVTIKAGKQSNRRTLQFALQALVAVFDTQAAPRTLYLDSSSSMESLASTGSATSTSNFSKTSSPATSPTNNLDHLPGKKRSFFNPAEVDKLPSAKQSMGKPSPRQMNKQDPSLQLNHQNAIRQKYSSPSASESDVPTYDESHHAKASDTGEAACSLDTSGMWSLPGRSKLPSRNRMGDKGRPNLYSTSASDSEDAAVSENNLSRFQSRSTLSLASQSSTLTAKSTNSSNKILRHTRTRASMASTKSSASEHTLTNDSRSNSQENLVSTDSADNRQSDMDNLSDSCHTATKETNSCDAEIKGHPAPDTKPQLQTAAGANKPWYEDDSSHEKTESGKREPLESSLTSVSSLEPSSPLIDPTAVAEKVLAETSRERCLVEAMQKWSVHSLAQKRAPESQENPDKCNEVRRNKDDATQNVDDTVAVAWPPEPMEAEELKLESDVFPETVPSTSSDSRAVVSESSKFVGDLSGVTITSSASSSLSNSKPSIPAKPCNIAKQAGLLSGVIKERVTVCSMPVSVAKPCESVAILDSQVVQTQSGIVQDAPDIHIGGRMSSGVASMHTQIPGVHDNLLNARQQQSFNPTQQHILTNAVHQGLDRGDMYFNIPLMELAMPVGSPEDVYFSDSSLSQLSKIPEEDEEAESVDEKTQQVDEIKKEAQLSLSPPEVNGSSQPKGVMKNGPSLLNKSQKSVKFQDEIELKRIASSRLSHSDSLSSSDGSMQAKSYEVRFAEKRLVGGPMAKQITPVQNSKTVPTPSVTYQNVDAFGNLISSSNTDTASASVSGTYIGPLSGGVIKGYATGPPELPRNHPRTQPSVDNRQGQSGFTQSGSVVRSQFPPSYSAEYLRKPPPPYPGTRGSLGSHDSSSSLESLYSPQGSSPAKHALPNYTTPQNGVMAREPSPQSFGHMQMTPQTRIARPSVPHGIVQRSPQGVSPPVGYHNLLNSEGSSSEQESYEFYSPQNLQRTSMQLYKTSTDSSVPVTSLSPQYSSGGAAMNRITMRQQLPIAPSHRFMYNGYTPHMYNQATGVNGGQVLSSPSSSSEHSSPYPNELQVQRMSAEGRVNGQKEWYLSDSDSVSSYQEGSALPYSQSPNSAIRPQHLQYHSPYSSIFPPNGLPVTNGAAPRAVPPQQWPLKRYPQRHYNPRQNFPNKPGQMSGTTSSDTSDQQGYSSSSSYQEPPAQAPPSEWHEMLYGKKLPGDRKMDKLASGRASHQQSPSS